MMETSIQRHLKCYNLSKVPKGSLKIPSKIPSMIKKSSKATTQNDGKQGHSTEKCQNAADDKKSRLLTPKSNEETPSPPSSAAAPFSAAPPQYIPRSNFPRIPLHRLMPDSLKSSSMTFFELDLDEIPPPLHKSSLSRHNSIIKFDMSDGHAQLNHPKPQKSSSITDVMSDIFGGDIVKDKNNKQFPGEINHESPEMLLDDVVFKVTLERGTPEPHPLRKSILGLMTMNKALDEIGDESLWKLIPRGKVYGVPPFEKKCDPRINTFLKWEQEMLLERKKTLLESMERNRDFSAFKKTLALERSMYVKIGLRHKLNWDLVKKYKAFKAKWDSPQSEEGKSGLDDDDHGL